MNRIKRCAAFFLALVFIAAVAVLPASAAVTGLPSGVLIVDQDGFQPDSATGTYYLQVTDMLPGQTYTKQIHVQNLNVNNTFHIYMQAEPVSTKGDILLFDEVTLELELDGTQVYTGSPSGLGNIDMQNDALDLGSYAEGQQRQLTCNVTLNKEVGNAGHDGQYGDIDFKWIFTAVQDEKEDETPKTSDIVRTSLIVFLGALVLAVVFFAIQKKRHEKEDSSDEQ